MAVFQRFRRDSGGLAAVEFALILPIAVAFLFGEFVLGEALSISRKVSIAARTVGDLVARTNNGSITSAQLMTILNASAQIVAPFPANDTNNNPILSVVVAELSTDGSGKTTVTWNKALNATGLTNGAAFTPPTGVAQPNTSLIYTTVTYAYPLPVGQNIFGTSVPISNTFYMQPRTSAGISCVGC
ncbi:Flp pilus assembly protein TadG [Rhodoblastus acidophilus]|uniref:TadE/TadG family type IV pilus assembly protein n=1 Tax=Rhodoblastus acidophilus TaxID=1074 RepID=UPI0022256C04|nr:TadE/TadG family type IV pilus assembly protein [Rhodoblastus acidophilus]MCW2282343.1 Flp pilus assembly protein TadG [Rhodoblastus acidophilus]MCW2331252.1 Flp pilus assembly protein TadG [Rhodoblastus acidophilus]